MRPIDTGDTAWMLISTALVMLMTIPGLALFYGGMVRRKNVLSTLVQSFGICCLVSLVWVIVGYSLCFSTGNAWIGDFSRVFLRGIASHFHQGSDSAFTLGAGSAVPTPMTIPESVYLLYQMSFAIITPALITGAFAERIKFSALCLFTVLWSIFVYAPVAHWVWSPLGWVAGLGAVDFAGGTVVHINSGIAGLVCALMIGPRRGLKRDDMSPHNLSYAIIGASLLWVGWFGFNAGSALGANGRAGMAMLTTQVAAAAGGMAWMLVEWWRMGKPTALGIISGAVAGLVAVTPAAGFVLPSGALAIGLIAGSVCFYSATVLKNRLGYDDSLDAFGVHGVGGIVGALLTGIFAYGPFSATADNPAGVSGSWTQLLHQGEAVAVTILWSVVVTAVIIVVVNKLVGIRVSDDDEQEGLDMTQHGEKLN
ncbi:MULTISPECIES: ammonium transporter [unclassified Saccharibacter]|uniref:ammonium transporter n=1 Tax=unclassified Saccharibacter TaxID=2648722 RepID=UPI00132287FE|nr:MULTISPECIES: ammonium transporter [unclassified Saccharibacter]MXV35120.1 ammonium transporter [Saccharibacter sp. EH611]MXV57333.1 ammonium transporter [Saccharibacter sp. EH70]MXV64806.1 ammonium transporter [Saccharibacter sp. EH60]